MDTFWYNTETGQSFEITVKNRDILMATGALVWGPNEERAVVVNRNHSFSFEEVGILLDANNEDGR